jgi:hypothetical protein
MGQLGISALLVGGGRQEGGCHRKVQKDTMVMVACWGDAGSDVWQVAVYSGRLGKRIRKGDALCDVNMGGARAEASRERSARPAANPSTENLALTECWLGPPR